LFSLSITSFKVVHLKKRILLFSSVFFSVRLSLSHDLGGRCIQVAQVFFMLFFIILSFILSFKIWFFLKLNIFFVLSHIGLSCPHDPTRRFWQSHLVLLVLCFLILYFFIVFFLISSFYIFIHRNWRSLFFYFSFYDIEPWICSSFLKIQWQHLIIVFNTKKKNQSNQQQKKQVIYLVLTSNMGTKANSNPRKPQANDVISRKTVASSNSMFMTTSLRHESMAQDQP